MWLGSVGKTYIRRLLIGLAVLLVLFLIGFCIRQLHVLDEEQDLGPGVRYTPVNPPRQSLPNHIDLEKPGLEDYVNIESDLTHKKLLKSHDSLKVTDLNNDFSFLGREA